jgi:hypothetical protein
MGTVCFLLGDSPASVFLYADVSELFIRSIFIGGVMEWIKSSEKSVYKKRTPGNHPKGNIEHHEHGESLKSS